MIPKYQELEDHRQVELSTTPFYHPILPLIKDGGRQIKDALGYHRKFFKNPKGMCPSEGGVSNESFHLIAANGFKWTATDNQILKKSCQGCSFGDLYKPYKFSNTDLVIFFRDKELADLIGFKYANMSPTDAVNDFFWHLYEIKNRIGEINGDHVITIALDGENCWEYFSDDGHEFLNKLYQRFEDSLDFETVLFSDIPTDNLKKLENIHAGSWINTNFDIWIGHPDKQNAWNFLNDTRDFLLRFKDHENFKKAQEEVYIAEGSDWFWWYGDDYSSNYDAEFDKLFRMHLKNVYLLLGIKVPEKLNEPILNYIQSKKDRQTYV
ncbi:MAG: hypothetical protein GY817_00915 [bacterium]|nr:hypothetical protein [bacterium]